MSDDFLFIEEQQYIYSHNPFYVIATQVDEARMKMFELVEIPHLCLEIHNCFFSCDMQCIKKAHQYMKQSISNSYYNEIKKNLQKQLSILIKQQQKFTESYKQYKEDIDFQNDSFSQQIVNSLTHYFSNPQNSKFSTPSHTITNNVIDFSSSNESEYASDNNFNLQRNLSTSHRQRINSD